MRARRRRLIAAAYDFAADDDAATPPIRCFSPLREPGRFAFDTIYQISESAMLPCCCRRYTPFSLRYGRQQPPLILAAAYAALLRRHALAATVIYATLTIDIADVISLPPLADTLFRHAAISPSPWIRCFFRLLRLRRAFRLLPCYYAFLFAAAYAMPFRF